MVCTILADRYRVIRRLGKGGMGTVYLARDKKINMLWAIKDLGDSDTFLSYARKSEISVLRRVSHPNLPRVTDIFDEGKRTWMVMDYIEGKTLEEILGSGKKIPQKKFYQWSLEITSALQYLHSMNPPVIYRDLKPSNIIIRPSGSAVLIDFGTAKSFEKESDEYALGTKGYAAPEQYKGKSDERSDIYSAGRVIGKMAGSKANSLIKHICRKCTALDPKDRYQNAEGLKQALLLSRDAYKFILVTAVVLALVLAGTWQNKSTAENTVKDVEEISRNSRMEGIYDNALMCFYDLKDIDAALSYFDELDESSIPEVSWYKRLCRILLLPESTGQDVIEAAREFKRFNDETVAGCDPKRKLKNDTDIARIYLMYSKGDAVLLREAADILERVNAAYDKEPSNGELKLNALGLLQSAYKSLGETENRQENLIKAIQCGNRLKTLKEDDTEYVIRRYLDNAAMLEELSMYKKAKEEYEECEKLYPYQSAQIYTEHLRLLLKLKADSGEIRKIYKEAMQVRGITDNKKFKKISERIDHE